jgi:glutamate dehydrogenase/leucine dehydrogenase
MKAFAFDTTFSNALALKNAGGAYGGADFNPFTKSETEIQVFYFYFCLFIIIIIYILL